MEGCIGRKLSWEKDDLALQNIQARVRSPGVWMLANVQGALLLATSNRSEASVGYATMDGDTSGGLSPLVAIDKAFIREWLVWMEKTGPTGITALPALAAVNAQEPTAELRPSEEGQTDEERSHALHAARTYRATCYPRPVCAGRGLPGSGGRGGSMVCEPTEAMDSPLL